MECNTYFKNFIKEYKFTGAQLGELNTFIFHEWNQTKAREKFPQELVDYISKSKNDPQIMEEIHHLLLPLDLRTE